MLPSLAGHVLLVTGAAGFLGERLLRLGVEQGAHVVALCHRRTPPVLPGPAFTQVLADIRDPHAVRRAMLEVRPDILIHGAALVSSRPDPELLQPMLDTHVRGAAHVLEAAYRCGTRRVVLIGSSGEYGAAKSPCSEQGPALPLEPYGLTKLLATELALGYQRAFGLCCTVIRPFLIYGPGETEGRLLPCLWRAVLQGARAIDLTEGDQQRDFVYVDDVAEGILRAAVTPAASGEVLNLGTGQPQRVRDVVTQALAIAADEGGAPLEPRFGALAHRPGEPRVLYADTAHLRAVLGWTPTTPLAEGLRRSWRWFLGLSEPGKGEPR